MPKPVHIILLVLLAAVYSFVVSLRYVSDVDAAAAACSVTVSPTSVTTYSSTSFTITIENTDSASYSWMEITRPSSDFTITGGGVGGWSFGASESTITLTGGTLSASSSKSVTVNAQVPGGTEGSHNWTVKVSDDSGGASPYTCTGTLTAQISGSGTDTYVPQISSIAVGDVSNHDATISWTTNEASNSVVQYGTTNSYGSTVTETDLVTSHEVVIPSLSKDTTYHFKVQSTDAASNMGESDDNTFVTSLIEQTVTVTTTTTKTVTKEVTVLVEDTTAPVPKFTTGFSNPFLLKPVIEGTVTDNTGVLSVEYSVDGGRNYLPVNSVSNPEAESTTYSFSPLGLLDGNYNVKVRATDIAGNTAETEVETLVFDRLPPQVGTSVISIGPQVLLPQSSGQIVTLPGLDQRVAMDAIGGPIEVQVQAQVQGGSSQIFALTKNTDNGLWFGTMSFSEPGTYSVIVSSVDGADNQTEQSLPSVVVLDPGRVLYKGAGVNGASVTVYAYDPDLARYIVWGGGGFGQENPQSTDENGTYRLILPKGRYYLEVSGQGFKTLRTSIFDIEKSLPMTFDLVLSRDIGGLLGNIPFGLSAAFDDFVKVDISYPTIALLEHELTGKELVSFRLNDFDDFDLRGKPTVLTAINTWHPAASEQVKILNELADDSGFNVVAIVPHESASRVEVYKERGGYENLRFVVDTDGTLVSLFGINASPMHFFVDRKGLVTGVYVGSLNREGILAKMF